MLNFRICDTRGLSETLGPDVIDINFLLDGHIPDGYVVRNSSRLVRNQTKSNIPIIHLAVYSVTSRPRLDQDILRIPESKKVLNKK